MNNQFSIQNDQQVTGAIAQNFVSNVFSFMFSALAITGVMAYWFGTNLSLLQYLITETGFTPLGWIVTFAPFVFVLVMNFAFERLSFMTLMTLFVVYSLLMGMSLSFIFVIYTSGSIATTFAVCATTFGIMALVGYTTKTDLTKMGSFLMMAVIGLIVGMIINWFVGSETMDIIISLLGVLIFTGLTAYKVQMIKRIGAGIEYGSESTAKLSVIAALSLYLTFINLFLFLLRFLGDRK